MSTIRAQYVGPLSGVATPTFPVAFSAAQNAAQTIPNGTYTKVQYNSEEFDTNSYYDNATNYRFSPLIAGYYWVHGSIGGNFSGAGGVTTMTVAIYKNDTAIQYSPGHIGGVKYQNEVNGLVYFNGTTDYVEIFCYHNFGSSVNTFGTTQTTKFQAYLVASA